MTSAFSAMHRPLHTIGVAALSLSSFCFAARGQDSQVAPSPESRPAASDSLHPLLSAPTRYMRTTLGSAKPVVAAAANVALQANSPALSALSRTAPIWNRGGKAASSDVMAILEACTVEHGSSVKPERLRAILKQHNDEPALQGAVLRYLFEKKDNYGRPETLAPFLKSQNPDLVALALLVQSKQIPQLRSADQYKSFVDHPSSKVRQAAAVAMMSSGVPLPPMSAFDCFSASKLLRFDHYELGFEARLANAMEAAIETHCSTTSSIEVVHLELPLLHLLQRIDAGCPGFLDVIERSGVGSFERFCAGLREMIREERDAVRDRVILNSETSLFVAMHRESIFSEAYVADLGISAGIPLMYAIKEGENKKQSAPPIANQPLADAGEKPESGPGTSITVQETKGDGAKGFYCQLLPEILRGTQGPIALFHAMHGGFNHSYFREGTGESIKDDNLRSPIALSYEEIAQMLFNNCLSGEDAIECGHITLFLDACYQYTVAEQILAELESLAQRADKRVSSYPLVTSISQPLMLSAFQAINEEVYAPRWFLKLLTRTQEDRTLTVSDLLEADALLNHEFDEVTRDPKTLRMTKGSYILEHAKGADGQGVKGFVGQAPAVFGTRPINLRDEVQALIDLIKEEGKYRIPDVPVDNKLPVNTFLEIG